MHVVRSHNNYGHVSDAMFLAGGVIMGFHNVS